MLCDILKVFHDKRSLLSHHHLFKAAMQLYTISSL
nr:MAG TPA: hypothetical protein [Caudoviricetes sp.]